MGNEIEALAEIQIYILTVIYIECVANRPVFAEIQAYVPIVTYMGICRELKLRVRSGGDYG
jgi:hypothetical protein